MSMSLRLYVLVSLLACIKVHAATVDTTFQVTANVVNGCSLGTSGLNGTNFGTINFGTMPSIENNIDVASSNGAGSIVVTCTPGTSITLDLDYGLHNGNSSFRYLSNGITSLSYQLYRDSSYNQIWGTMADSLAYSISSFPETAQTYTVYARLFSTSIMPSMGIYTDTITVTLTY